jgi:tartronate-semialdehyde synthase
VSVRTRPKIDDGANAPLTHERQHEDQHVERGDYSAAQTRFEIARDHREQQAARGGEEAEGLGCKAIRVRKQEEIDPAIQQAEQWMAQYKVPVVIEIMLERVTNISMGTEIDNVIEFEELALAPEDAPNAFGMLD